MTVDERLSGTWDSNAHGARTADPGIQRGSSDAVDLGVLVVNRDLILSPRGRPLSSSSLPSNVSESNHTLPASLESKREGFIACRILVMSCNMSVVL